LETVLIPREEQLYERKAIFGRDVSSVFPMEAQKAKQEHMKQLSEAVGLGEGRFITEKQVKGSIGFVVTASGMLDEHNPTKVAEATPLRLQCIECKFEDNTLLPLL